jgi:hypothetical protein
MVAARLEYMSERVAEDGMTAALALGSPQTGTTTVTGFTAGVNYWCSKRIRASLNYAVTSFGGTAKIVTALPAKHEQELLMRVALTL